MKRFVNSMIVLLCMWGGTLCFIGAWIWLCIACGGLNAALFAALVWTAAAVNRRGPTWAARFISWRITVAKVEADKLEGKVLF